MFLSDLAIRRPIVTVTVMIALVVFGLVALFSLETDEFPDVQQPVVGVTIAYPGASPEMVEREVVDPLEDAIFAISGVDASKTRSISSDGLAQLIVFFQFSKDPQQAEQDIRDAISSKRADLPPEMKEPILTRFDPSELPIVSLALTSDSLSLVQLTRLADPGIVGDLRGVPGVAQATVVGGLEPELTVDLLPKRLAAAKVSVAQVVQALQAQNLAVPAGRIDSHRTEIGIRLQGRLKTPEQFEQVTVAQRGGKAIRLGALAHVYAGHEEQRTAAFYDGHPAVGIDILKTKGFSTTTVAEQILDRVARIRKTLPEGAHLDVVVDSGQQVKRSVNNVEEALIEGAILTVLVVFLFLNSWRSTVITGLALPISVLSAFISVWIFGFTLNTMSLLGLSLAIGILIDDAIVVRENIVRHVNLGAGHREAAHAATQEIGLAVMATTFSIVAVFVPIAFISGVAGQWFKPFALTIACAVLVSLFVSFSLDPMLSAYWLDPQLERGARRGWLGRGLNRFNAWFERRTGSYERLIGWALDHRKSMVALAVIAFVLAIVLQLWVGGAGFVPNSDRSELMMMVETSPSASLAYTERKVEAVAALTRAQPGVAHTYSTLGTPLPLRSPGVDQALIDVHLLPKSQRSRSQTEIGEGLRKVLSRIGGVNVSVFTSGFGGAFKQIQLDVLGPDPGRLEALAKAVEKQVASTPGAVDVGLSTRGVKPELVVNLNRGLAGSLGITAAEVAQNLRPAFAGVKAGDWVDSSGQTRDVTVRYAARERTSAADLSQLPLLISGPNGTTSLIPLGQVADVRTEIAPAQIQHLDRQKVITVEANVAGQSLSEVMTGIRARLSHVEVPGGYSILSGGETQSQQEVFGSVFLALIVAVLLMYLILVIQFNSFVDPLAILVALPLSLIGVVLALLITGDTLNIMSLIGVILLMGIVTKNAILLIDFAKRSRKAGASMREALIEAGRIRLRPIIMTTVALIFGMLPIAWGVGEGGDFRAPLGRAVIGGVITATVLTLLVIPTIYEIFDGWRSGLKRRFGARRRGNVPPGAHDAPQAP